MSEGPLANSTSRLRKNHFGTAELRWPAHWGQQENAPAGCSKRPDFSPAQPWRAETRLVPSKAAASYHLIRGGWDYPNCAQRSHPPTHWHAETCHLPGRGPSGFPHFALRGAARLSFTARIGRAPFYRARSASTKDGLAAPPPALLRPRVARALGSSQLPHLLFQHPAKPSSRNQPSLRRLHPLTCQEFP